ncbi:MAG: WD40 repeat domain-containing protein [bacterium]
MSKEVKYHNTLAKYFEQLADPGSNQHWDGINIRAFNELPFQLDQSNKDKLKQLLWNPYWYQAKLNKLDINALISDFLFSSEEIDLQIVREAFHLSLNILAEDKTQLASQLIGRLIDIDEPKVKSLKQKIINIQNKYWIQPLNSALTPAGEAVSRLLQSHEEIIKNIAIDSIGRISITASEDMTLKVWDIRESKELFILKGHQGIVNDVAIDSTGFFAVSASDDGTLKVWDIKHGAELKTLKGHTSCVNAVALNRAGSIAISVSRDSTMNVWNLETGQQINSFKIDTPYVKSIDMDSAGKIIVFATDDHAIKIWDILSGSELHSIQVKIHDEYTDYAHPNCVAINSLGNIVASAHHDASVRIWDVQSGSEIYTLYGHSASVNDVSMDSTGQIAVSLDIENQIKIWDLKSGREICSFKGTRGILRHLAIDEMGRTAVSILDNHTIAVIDLTRINGTKTKEEEQSLRPVKNVLMNDAGSIAVSSTGWRMINIWDTKTYLVRHILWTGNSETKSMAIDASGTCIVSTYAQDLKIFDSNSGETLKWLYGKDGNLKKVLVNQSGELVASLTSTQILKVWNLETDCELLSKKLSYGECDLISINSTNFEDILTLFSFDTNSLIFLDLYSGEEIEFVQLNEKFMTPILIDNAAKIAIFASEDNTIRVYNLEDKKELSILRGHTDIITGVALDFQLEIAISTSRDHTLRVWDYFTSEEIARYRAECSLYSCSLIGLGEIIMTGDEHGKVHFLRFVIPESKT